MLELHPQILERDGKEAFVVLSWEEFEAIRAALEDAEDLRILREARDAQRDEATISHAELKQRMGL
jgi:PHD/YefM family antitoxin component YafN of YafNO toxin-antitoxin module